MVGHEDIGTNQVGVLFRRGLKRLAIMLLVMSGQETGFAVVTALNDVLVDAWQDKAGFSGHGSPPCESQTLRQRQRSRNIEKASGQCCWNIINRKC